VDVLAVLVRVRDRVMDVGMAVSARRHRVVMMTVMAVVVAVHVLVFDGDVMMRVLVPLGGVQPDAGALHAQRPAVRGVGTAGVHAA